MLVFRVVVCARMCPSGQGCCTCREWMSARIMRPVRSSSFARTPAEDSPCLMNSSCRLRQALRANFTARVGRTPSGGGASRVLLGHKSSPRRRLSIPAAVRLRLFPSNSPSAARAPSTVARSAQLLEMIVSTVSSAASGLGIAKKHSAYVSAACRSSPLASSEIALQHIFETLRALWHGIEELGKCTSAILALKKIIKKLTSFLRRLGSLQLNMSNSKMNQL